MTKEQPAQKEHSPLPLLEVAPNKHYANFKGSDLAAFRCYDTYGDNEGETLCAGIVRAVNSHKRLVDALKDAHKYTLLVENVGSSPDDYELRKRIESILSIASATPHGEREG